MITVSIAALKIRLSGFCDKCGSEYPEQETQQVYSNEIAIPQCRTCKVKEREKRKELKRRFHRRFALKPFKF